MDRELDLAAGAGASVVRVDVVWGSLETNGKGRYSQWYVEKLDRFVSGADARGMKVIATLWSSPCWASSAPDSVKQGCAGAWWDRGVGAYPPSDSADYGDAARFVTSRYGTKLAALEVWNEPNLDNEQFWKAEDKAGAYAKLLKAAYPRAKAGNADVPVLAGAIAFADRPFLDRLYANGIKGYEDGISIHPYNEARHPADRWQDQWKKYTLLPGIEWIRQGQQAAGDLKPIWVTEFGWTTGTGSGWKVSDAQQGQFIGDSFALLAQKDYVKGAVVYNLREKGDDPAAHEDNFGLVNSDFSPKPAYASLRQALTEGGTPVGVPPVETPPVQAPPVQAPPVQAPPVQAPSAPRVEAAVGRPAGVPAGSSPSSGSPSVQRPTGSGRPASRSKRRRAPRKLTLRVKRRGAGTYASGRAPRASRLTLRVSRCPSNRIWKVRSDARGNFNRRLGSGRELRGCRVTAAMQGSQARALRVSVG